MTTPLSEHAEATSGRAERGPGSDLGWHAPSAAECNGHGRAALALVAWPRSGLGDGASMWTVMEDGHIATARRVRT